MSKLTLFAILCYTAFVCHSCKKEVIDRCPAITASATAVVDVGGSIELTAPDYENVAFYEWTGPYGFESTEQNPVIYNVRGFESGRYTLRVGITDGCTQTTKTDSVIINIPPSPCTPSNNTATLSGQVMSFSFISGVVRGGSWFLEGGGIQGDIELEFPGTVRPAPGVYQIVPLGDNWRVGSVRVRMVAMSSNWPASSGKLYVSVSNNKVTATFCTVPVFNQTFYFNATASGRITEL